MMKLYGSNFPLQSFLFYKYPTPRIGTQPRVCTQLATSARARLLPFLLPDKSFLVMKHQSTLFFRGQEQGLSMRF